MTARDRAVRYRGTRRGFKSPRSARTIGDYRFRIRQHRGRVIDVYDELVDNVPHQPPPFALAFVNGPQSRAMTKTRVNCTWVARGRHVSNGNGRMLRPWQGRVKTQTGEGRGPTTDSEKK